MNSYRVSATLALVLAVSASRIPVTPAAPPSRPPEQTPGNNPDSLARKYENALSRISSPKLEERKKSLRTLQQRGYAATLQTVLANDGVSALLSFLKTRLQIEFSLSHVPVLVDITHAEANPDQRESPYYLHRKKFTIPLPSVPRRSTWIPVDIDWSFPKDPWREE